MIDHRTYTDLELLVLIKAGDQVAFTEIYDRYWRILYAHIYKMLRDEDGAKDIMQDVFSKIWADAAKLSEPVNFAGYLYTIARNKVLNTIRQQKFQNDYLESLAAYANDISETTLHYLDERDLAAAIEREIFALPPRMRQVFEMSRKENMSYKEIGQRLGTSEQTVKKQVGKSLKIIRNNLKVSGGAALLLLVILR
ncbi:RNA polymerase sigma-70 factor [Pedobacter frigidisoli]|uniref:RNA polymerase sigma-70 factor n=1 Tax=Pedobacter frigidisoli TaxID=2530455 RepID=A0A4R0P0N6_9SPHI|nr:RNA polymerase sigma-70 factor [Pedobacter frigidisoli]TCD05935.1 RNA polymerase sigma-70 factor [Pedobacter frigidisoli]